MRNRVGVIGLLILLHWGSAAAQDPLQTLKDAVVKKQMFLRGFSAEKTMRWHWDGTALVEDAPLVHTLGVLVAESVKLRGSVVEIRGTRGTLLRDSATTFKLSTPEKDVRVLVDLAGADVPALLNQLAALLFYPNSESALADVPLRLRDSLPATANAKCCGARTPPVPKSCDCADTSAECSKGGRPEGMVGRRYPNAVFVPNAEYSEEARRAKLNASVQVSMDVDVAGRPHDFWIIRPAGLGLDEKAADAAEQYVFSPATCHGTPIPMSLVIEVTFAIH
jgi:TonB family protein